MDQGEEREPTSKELSDLYSRAPEQFVAARNDLAARLTREKRREAAAAVRRLSRPSPALWAVNRLSREAAEEIAGLLDGGNRLRRAQSRVMGGDRRAADDLRDLGAEQGRLVARLRGWAGRILTDAGHAASDGTLRRVESTLRSAALAGSEVRRALTEGRVTAELEPTGFLEVPIFSVLPGGAEEDEEAAAPEESRKDRAVAAEAGAIERARLAEGARQRLAMAERALATRATDAQRARDAGERAEERTRSLEALLAAARDDAARSAQRARLAEEAVAEAQREVDEARRSAPD